MTDPDHKAWEIALAQLSTAERERVLKIAQLMSVDPGDPVWPMLAAAGLARDGMTNVMSEAAEKIDNSLKELSQSLEAVRQEEFERFREQLEEQHARFFKELRDQHKKALEEYKEESRARSANVNDTRPERKQGTTAWKRGAAVVLLVAVAGAVAFGAGTVIGRQNAAATHDRIAGRFEGPYSINEAKLLDITGANLDRATRIMSECRRSAFEPEAGGRACRITVWMQKPAD